MTRSRNCRNNFQNSQRQRTIIRCLFVKNGPPAMEAGVATSAWMVQDLVTMADVWASELKICARRLKPCTDAQWRMSDLSPSWKCSEAKPFGKASLNRLRSQATPKRNAVAHEVIRTNAKRNTSRHWKSRPSFHRKPPCAPASLPPLKSELCKPNHRNKISN